MKKFLAILAVVMLSNLFSIVAQAAEDAPPSIPDPFGSAPPSLELDSNNSTPPSLQLDSGTNSSGSSSSSSSGSGYHTNTTTTTPTTTPAYPNPPADEVGTESVPNTGPEMAYLLLLGLLLIGGYQFAMKKK